MAFSQQMVDNFKEAFACFDSKGHGVVSTENLGRVMNAFGLQPSQDELKNMITEVDGSGKGAVDFAEFMKMMSRGGSSIANELKETFAMFNKSGSGSITAAELKLVMSGLGEKFTDKDIDDMISVASKGGSSVNFQQFENILIE
eukprot:m.220782 g.220782  ORF g.220782 m.220782 type:complete len:144 (-) comp10452_c0_seq1:74-505(-)